MFEKMRARWRRAKRVKVAKTAKAPLREFVYLDEVSVYSLLASRQGALASEYTDTKSATLLAEVGGSVGATGGIVKGDVSSKINGTEAQSSQIVRKSTIQAAFKELREGEEGRLAIRPIVEADASLPRFDTWANLERSIGQPISDQWIIDPAKFDRGDLVEFEIELRADDQFKISAASSALTTIVEQSLELFPAAVREQYAQVVAINRVLDNLLAGLVPVRCRLVDYKVTNLSGKNYLVHRKLLAGLHDSAAHPVADAFVVGVTEQRLFWKDLRRVLFSNSQYRIMCRLNHSNFRTRWSPIKLVDVVQVVVPNLNTAMDTFKLSLLQGQRHSLDEPSNARARMRQALQIFGTALASEHGEAFDVDHFESIESSLDNLAAGYQQPESRKAAFNSIAEFLAREFHFRIDPENAVHLRQRALVEAGIQLDGSIVDSGQQHGGQQPAPQIPATEEHLLDSEIVAIYW